MGIMVYFLVMGNAGLISSTGKPVAGLLLRLSV